MYNGKGAKAVNIECQLQYNARDHDMSPVIGARPINVRDETKNFHAHHFTELLVLLASFRASLTSLLKQSAKSFLLA